jgi:LysR family transcriptional regulator, nitrogen assimilation regulatory protein
MADRPVRLERDGNIAVMELDNIDATKKMVRQGLGVALLPHTAVAEELEAGTLTPVDIVDATPVRRRIVAVRRRDAGSATGVVAAFLATLDGLRTALQRAALRAGPGPLSGLGHYR